MIRYIIVSQTWNDDPGIPARRETPPERKGSRRLSPEALAALEDGTPDNTSRAYREDRDRFIEWCGTRGFTALPADAYTLTEYATWAAYTEGQKPGTIERARWAILKWHRLAGAPLPATDGFVGVLKGYRVKLEKAKDPKRHTKKASAAGRDALSAMLATLDRDTLVGKRDAAVILVGFGIGARRGEIASLNIEEIEFRPAGMQVTVYRQKVKKSDDPVIHYRSDPAMCPVRAAEALIAALGRSSGPLFVRIDRHGNPAHPMMRNGKPIGDESGRMSDHAVAEVIRKSALAAGLPGNWSGHSLRRGLATSMHVAGASREAIEQQGGWTPGSTAVSGYIDEAKRWANDVLEGVL